MSIVGFEREYLDGLVEVAARRREGQNLLVLFLGSTIGNFDRPAAAKFLREVRQILQPGDSLLLGTDLEKPIPQLLAAYDDPLGVTAAFNLNLLARINRELDADFVLEQFEHVARFNPEARSVEMRLRSTAKTDGIHSPSEFDCSFSRRGNHLDREQPQVFGSKKCRGSPRMPASSARRSGLTRNGLSLRTCSSRSEFALVLRRGGRLVRSAERSSPDSCSATLEHELCSSTRTESVRAYVRRRTELSPVVKRLSTLRLQSVDISLSGSKLYW